MRVLIGICLDVQRVLNQKKKVVFQFSMFVYTNLDITGFMLLHRCFIFLNIFYENHTNKQTNNLIFTYKNVSTVKPYAAATLHSDKASTWRLILSFKGNCRSL